MNRFFEIKIIIWTIVFFKLLDYVLYIRYRIVYMYLYSYIYKSIIINNVYWTYDNERVCESVCMYTLLSVIIGNCFIIGMGINSYSLYYTIISGTRYKNNFHRVNGRPMSCCLDHISCRCPYFLMFIMYNYLNFFLYK